MSDFSWKALGDIVVGDQLLAPDEVGPHSRGASGSSRRQWRLSEVVAAYHHRRPVINVETDQGQLVGTGDHRVLTRYDNGSHSKRWLEMGKLTRRSNISFIGEPWKRKTHYPAGWLAGFFDGEGHIRNARKIRLGVAQNEGETLDRCRRYLGKCGYRWSEEANQKCVHLYLLGGISEIFRFLGEAGPSRLKSNARLTIANHGPGLATSPARVFCREQAGMQDVVDITTTTGTFVAEGFVVHNCGASGELLRKSLGEAGIDPTTIAYVNTVSCLPTTDGKQRAPSPQEVKACAQNRETQLDATSATWVLLTGNVPLQAYFPDLKIGRAHGQPFVDGKRVLYPVFHPAAILRNRGWMKDWVADLETFAEMIRRDSWASVQMRCIKCSVTEDETERMFVDISGVATCGKCGPR